MRDDRTLAKRFFSRFSDSDLCQEAIELIKRAYDYALEIDRKGKDNPLSTVGLSICIIVDVAAGPLLLWELYNNRMHLNNMPSNSIGNIAVYAAALVLFSSGIGYLNNRIRTGATNNNRSGPDDKDTNGPEPAPKLPPSSGGQWGGDIYKILDIPGIARQDRARELVN